MAGDKPLVSIGMPVCNCQATLRSALNSLLAQTYSNWELLLMDDGSSDESLKIAKQFSDPRIKICSDGKFRGLIKRLNQAIDLSCGEYFARMDGDDVAYPERLEKQVSYLEEHPDVDLLGAWVMVFGRAGMPLGKRANPEPHAAICAKPFAGFPIAHPTYIGRIEWFRRYGYRQEALRCEDQDLLLRSYLSSKFANLPEILLGYREEKLSLKKILTGRWHFVRVAARKFFLQGRPDIAIRASLGQGFKGIADCLAVGTRLNYRLLRHRAVGVSDAERRSWEHVWQSINQLKRN